MKTAICRMCNQPFDYEPSPDEMGALFPPHHCPACKEKRRLESEAQMAATRLHELREQWKVVCPPSYRDTDPMRLPEVPLQTVLAWRYGSQGLLVHGETGRGKTRAVFQLLHRLHFDEGRKIIRFGVTDFGPECSKRFFDGDGVAWMNGLVKADVVFLDDLGKDRLTDRVESALFGLVEGRMSNLRPIIVTTNFIGDALAAKMTGDRGQPFVRRLRESCQDVVF